MPPTMRILLCVLLAATFFGRSVADPYNWLEDAGSARTQAWIERENRAADRVIGAYPYRAALAKRIAHLENTGPVRFSPQLSGTTLFYMQETPPQPQPVLMAGAFPAGTPHAIVDPARFGPAAAIEDVWPSPSGRYVAVGIAVGGSERTSIHVLDVRANTWFAETLAPCGGGTSAPALAWDAGERGFTYTRFPDDGSQFNIKLYHHVLGTAQGVDPLALGAISPIAEYELVTSDDAAHAAALVHFGDGAFDRVLLRTAGGWKVRVAPNAGITTGTYVGPHLLVVATAGSPNGRVAEVRADGTLTTLIPQQPDWAMQSIAPIRGGLLVVKSWGMRWRADQYSASGAFVRTVPLPASDIGIEAIASSGTSAHAVITYSGWAGPVDRWVSYDGDAGTLKTIYDVAAPSPDYAKIRVHDVIATSKDGTHIPVTVLAFAGTPQDGSAPTMLTGYGGFRLPTAPSFVGTRLAWLERGGVVAYVTLRGGNEFGEDWHQQGMLTNKQHVFDDFYAAAQALVASHWTNPHKLGIFGGSNGGLLVGAALVQHPEEYGAVVGASGIYDALRHHVFSNGAYNVAEYGSVSDRAQFDAIYAYSPYHNVKAGTPYPAVLLTTSENDPRVASWQSWKFGAALQAATSSHNPVIVFTRVSGGHGHGESFSQRVGSQTLWLTFLAQQLGLRQ